MHCRHLVLSVSATLVLFISAVPAVERELIGIAKFNDGSAVDQEWAKFAALLARRPVMPENPNATDKERYRQVCCAVAGEETAFQPEFVMQIKAVNAPAGLPLFGSIEIEEDDRQHMNYRLLRNGGPTEFIVFRHTGERRRFPTPVEQIQKFTSFLLESEDFPTSGQLNQIDTLVTTASDSREIGKLIRRLAQDKSTESAKALLAAMNKQLEQGVQLYEKYAELLNAKQLRAIATKKVEKPDMARTESRETRGEGGYSVTKKKAEKGQREKLMINIRGMKLPALVEKVMETFRQEYGRNLDKPEIPPTLVDLEIADEFEFEKSDDVWAKIGSEAGFKYEHRGGRLYFLPGTGKRK